MLFALHTRSELQVFFPVCIWKGTSDFAILLTPMDGAVDRDFFGAPPPSVLRRWECWREQTVLEGCWGPGRRLPAGLACWRLARCSWQRADLEARQRLAGVARGSQKPCLGCCFSGRMTPAVLAAAFCSAAGNRSAKPWAGFANLC